MEYDDSDFLKNYQKSMFTDNPSSMVGIQRKCLAQMYDFSLKPLNNESIAYLHEKNLDKYYKTMDQKGVSDTMYSRVKNILEENNIQTPVPVKTNIENLDLKSFLEPFPCSHSYRCEKSENFSKNGASQLVNFLVQNGAVKSDVPAVAVKQRTLAKCFAPQTCLKKDTKMIRTNSIENEPPSVGQAAAPKFCRSNSGNIENNSKSCFKTAHEELRLQNNAKKNGNSGNFGGQKRKLGIRRTVNSKFVPPLLARDDSFSSEDATKSDEWPPEIDDRLKNIDPKMIELIKSEIMDISSTVEWADIAGLEFAKTAIQEAVVWPMLRPDIFKGLRRPPKGILLFGPPGTGKTLIGKCVASQSKSTFFSISASSLTSKWVGDGEKMVRALFSVARCHQPAVIFIDEIDSLLSQRSDNEHESSRRIKTEFLVQLDGATTDNDERLLVIGATNRPQELDEAARRRFVKRLYIPLPEYEARLQLLTRLISGENNALDQENYKEIATLSNGYSGADIRNLCSEAALGPIRSIDMNMIEQIQEDEVRPLVIEDFHKAFARIKSSVSPKDLEQYVTWDKTYGSGL